MRSIAKEMGINEATLRDRLKCGNVTQSLGRNKEISVNLSVSDLSPFPKLQEKPNRSKHKSQKSGIFSILFFKNGL